MFAMMQFEFAIEDVEKLVARMHVRPRLPGLLQGNEFGEVRVHVTVGDHVAEALKKVRRIFDAGLRQTHAILAAMDPEHRLRFCLEEVGQILREHHRDASEIAQSGYYSPRFELRQEAR